MNYILFDLDGTLVNSKQGITKSAQYALQAFGVEVENLDDLECFIGPPLIDSFQKYYGFDEGTSRQLVEKYRERYNKIGLYECELYPEVEVTLQNLTQKGYKIAMASSKPENMCKRIMKHFNLEKYFEEIVGATPDGRIDTKHEVLQEVFKRLHPKSLEEVCLIGDTSFDVLGAKEAGIDCIGVSFGFGDRKEMLVSGALCICDTLKEVEETNKKL